MRPSLCQIIWKHFLSHFLQGLSRDLKLFYILSAYELVKETFLFVSADTPNVGRDSAKHFFSRESSQTFQLCHINHKMARLSLRPFFGDDWNSSDFGLKNTKGRRNGAAKMFSSRYRHHSPVQPQTPHSPSIFHTFRLKILRIRWIESSKANQSWLPAPAGFYTMVVSCCRVWCWYRLVWFAPAIMCTTTCGWRFRQAEL